MRQRRNWTRREFLVWSGSALAASALAACGGGAAPAEAPAEAPAASAPAAPQEAAQSAPAAAPSQYKEAPMLAEMVANGSLPPVEERLPPNPLVVQPTNVVGTYGGTMRGAALAPETTNDLQIGCVTGLFRFSNDLSVIYPEVAESYEWNDDATVCTIRLREGIKWSDGVPFTANDVMFYFNDWQFNKDLLPVLANQWQPGGQQMQVEMVDDFTVRFTFAVPNPAFALLNRSGAPERPYLPKHFMEAYHAQYNPDADADAKAVGYDNWTARFAFVADLNYGVMESGLPLLDPWVPTESDSQRQVYSRNPYYFKVDTEGNQLPYVDGLVVEYVTDLEVMNLKAISGELHVAGLDLLLNNYPVIKEGEQAGNYRTALVFSERGADVALAFNQNHPDPVLKEIFNDVRFRQAMSVAIDRNEINELVFLGQGTIRQATINESASFFKQEWADHYAQFDLDLANQLLDEMGLDQRGPDGIRLRPDGQPLQFQLEYLPHEGPKKEVCELVVRHWANVGVKAEAAGRDRAYLLERLNTMMHDASGWHVDRQLERAAYTYGYTQKLGPGGDSAITYCRGWKDWFNSQGASGVEPPQEAKDLFDAYAAWAQTVMGTPEYMEAATRVHDLIAQTLWVIGVIGQGPMPVIVRNDMENVFPEAVFNGEQRVWWGAANWFWHSHHAEQWFIKA